MYRRRSIIFLCHNIPPSLSSLSASIGRRSYGTARAEMVPRVEPLQQEAVEAKAKELASLRTAVRELDKEIQSLEKLKKLRLEKLNPSMDKESNGIESHNYTEEKEKPLAMETKVKQMRLENLCLSKGIEQTTQKLRKKDFKESRLKEISSDKEPHSKAKQNKQPLAVETVTNQMTLESLGFTEEVERIQKPKKKGSVKRVFEQSEIVEQKACVEENAVNAESNRSSQERLESNQTGESFGITEDVERTQRLMKKSHPQRVSEQSDMMKKKSPRAPNAEFIVEKAQDNVSSGERLGSNQAGEAFCLETMVKQMPLESLDITQDIERIQKPRKKDHTKRVFEQSDIVEKETALEESELMENFKKTVDRKERVEINSAGERFGMAEDSEMTQKLSTKDHVKRASEKSNMIEKEASLGENGELAVEKIKNNGSSGERMKSNQAGETLAMEMIVKQMTPESLGISDDFERIQKLKKERPTKRISGRSKMMERETFVAENEESRMNKAKNSGHSRDRGESNQAGEDKIHEITLEVAKFLAASSRKKPKKIPLLLPESSRIDASLPSLPDSGSKMQSNEFLAHEEEESGPTFIANYTHPWPEWTLFLEHLKNMNYFEDDNQETFGEYNSSQIAFSVRRAVTQFGRDRGDIFRFLSEKDIKAVASFGCPNTDRKAVNSAKRLRVLFNITEEEVCHQCRLKSSCARAFVQPSSHLVSGTLDVVQVLYPYAENVQPKAESYEAYPEDLQKSICNILYKLIQLTRTPTDSTSPKQEALLVMKSKMDRKRTDNSSPSLSVYDNWVCPNCGSSNPGRSRHCQNCATQLPILYSWPGDWECPNFKCRFHNFGKNIACLKCETQRPAHVGGYS